MEAKYYRIYKNLKKAILDGSYASGSRLPSSRLLAAELKVSRTTILEAFAHLEDEGFIEGKHGSGVYVKNITNNLNFKKAKINKTAESGKDLKKEKKHIFQPGLPDLKLFPFEIFARLTSRSYRQLDFSDYNYEESMGHKPLRESISAYLTLKRGVMCQASQVMVLNGSQEAIYLSAQVLMDHRSSVFIEDPSYTTAHRVFNHRGAKLYHITVDDEGMQTGKLNKYTPVLQNSLVYITPTHQFPLGYTMSIERRVYLLELAQKFQMTIIEDDYDSDFRYNGEPLSSLQGLGGGENIIYIGSLSKIFFPALRIGYCVLPEKYIPLFLNHRKLISRQPSLVNQAAAAQFFQKGFLYRHLKRMHKIYKTRRDCLTDLLKNYLSECLLVEYCDSGMHLVAYFKIKFNVEEIRKRGNEKNIALIFISDYMHASCKRDGLVLGFSHMDCIEMKSMVFNLAEILKK